MDLDTGQYHCKSAHVNIRLTASFQNTSNELAECVSFVLEIPESPQVLKNSSKASSTTSGCVCGRSCGASGMAIRRRSGMCFCTAFA
jgi:hypothetical protein